MYSGRLDKWHGLEMTIPQIKTVVLLEHMGPLRMGNISNYLGGAPSATTAILDRLVEREMVERVSDPNDRRVVLCQLTAQGRAGVRTVLADWTGANSGASESEWNWDNWKWQFTGWN